MRAPFVIGGMVMSGLVAYLASRAGLGNIEATIIGVGVTLGAALMSAGVPRR